MSTAVNRSRRCRSTRRLANLFVALLILGGVAGCSVKEDREVCPSMLIVGTDRLSETLAPYAIHVWGDGSYHCQDRIIPVDYTDRDWTHRVQKGYNTLVCMQGLDMSNLEDNFVRIHYGEESDRLWTHHSIVDCTGEYAYDQFIMHKQYCVLTIDVSGFEGEFPYTMEIRGESCGYNLQTAEPVSGDFRAVPSNTDEGIWQVILPRQRPQQRLVLYLQKDGKTEYAIDVANALKESNYSWETEDLNDAIIKLDSLSTELFFTGIDWEFGSEEEKEM